MNKRRVAIALLLVGGVTTGLAFKFRSTAEPNSQKGHNRPEIPDQEVYFQVFHHHVAMKKKAEELEKLGNDGKFLREYYKRNANLNTEQSKQFDEVASSCDEAVATCDAKAQAIIDRALRENGNGKLAKGTDPPVAPPELQTLWNERSQIILSARDRLHTALGHQEFQRFDQFVRKHVSEHMTIEPAKRERPNTRIGPSHNPHVNGGPLPKGKQP